MLLARTVLTRALALAPGLGLVALRIWVEAFAPPSGVAAMACPRSQVHCLAILCFLAVRRFEGSYFSSWLPRKALMNRRAWARLARFRRCHAGEDTIGLEHGPARKVWIPPRAKMADLSRYA